MKLEEIPIGFRTYFMILIHIEEVMEFDSKEEKHNYFTACILQHVEKHAPAFTKVHTPKDYERKLDGSIQPVKEYARTKGGIITVFEKAMVYGNPADALSYWRNKRGRRKAFGDFKGWIYGEIPACQDVRLQFEFTVDEPHIEKRKRRKRHLRKIGLAQWRWKKYHKDNTLPKILRRGIKYPKTPGRS